MKRTVTIALGTILLVCFGCARKPGQTSDNAPAGPGTNPSSSELADFKNLLFADQSLEEVSKIANPTNPPDSNDPFSLFVTSLAATRQGNTDQAKKDLQQVLAMPNVEARVRLWAWKALRDLGEKPPVEMADQIQGIVCELHNEAGVGTIAAYADGTARWLGAQNKVMVWDAVGTDAAIDRLIKELLEAAEPLIKGAPLSTVHKTPEPALDHFRVSILTFGGIRTIEVFGPEIVEDHPVAPVLTNGEKLLDALAQKSQKPN
jgi:hypothetical protein